MSSMKNIYYAFRHGQSRANVEGIIVSDPAVGTIEFGLTEEGRRQVHQSVEQSTEFDAETLIYASDFRRARETAEIICEKLGADSVVFDERLRERFFGDWEGKSHKNYSSAWKKDAYDPDQVFNGAESTHSVRERMWAVIQSLEKRYESKRVIIVSHGDPLMLLETMFRDMCPSKHRSLPYFETGGWRCLNS